MQCARFPGRGTSGLRDQYTVQPAGKSTCADAISGCRTLGNLYMSGGLYPADVELIAVINMSVSRVLIDRLVNGPEVGEVTWV
jgi:hypothetical protein